MCSRELLTVQVSIVVMFLAVVLSGCTTTYQQENTAFGEDTDGDGYKEYEDAFPNDSNLHELVSIYDSYGAGPDSDDHWYISSGDNKYKYWYVESDCKYVVISATVSEFEDGRYIINIPTDGVTISIINPKGTTKNTDGGFSSERFTVTSENWGQWEFLVSNNQDNPKIRVFVSIEIYK